MFSLFMVKNETFLYSTYHCVVRCVTFSDKQHASNKFLLRLLRYPERFHCLMTMQFIIAKPKIGINVLMDALR